MKTDTPSNFCCSAWRCWWDVTAIGGGTTRVYSWLPTHPLSQAGCKHLPVVGNILLLQSFVEFHVQLWYKARAGGAEADMGAAGCAGHSSWEHQGESLLCLVTNTNKHQPGMYKQKALGQCIRAEVCILCEGRGMQPVAPVVPCPHVCDAASLGSREITLQVQICNRMSNL